jgi:hypothetical protein
VGVIPRLHFCDDSRGICLRSILVGDVFTVVMLRVVHTCFELIATACTHGHEMFGSFCSGDLCAMMRSIVGTRAEAPVGEQNHNCSPILSA